MSTHSTILVIGGGPAGSTASSLLKREGFDVALFEREVFPRYHIGESILPLCHPVLELMGCREKVANHGFHKKTGQYFHWGKEQWDYRFGGLSGNRTFTWQVERAEFDKILLDHAASLGVDVRQGRRVTEVHFDGERPVAVSWADTESGESGRHEFDYLVDASGRAGIMANKYLEGRTVHESFRNVAVWGYWHDSQELPEAPAGATVASSILEGWVWAIPLRGKVMSVGAIMHRDRFNKLRDEGKSVEDIYHEAVQEARDLDRITAKATLKGDLRVEQDYSYTAQRYAGPGYFLSGDAACFLDPLLSTGVHLAMFSALLSACSLSSLLRGEVDEATVQEFYQESYNRTYLRYLAVTAAVYRQYDGAQSYFWEAQNLLADEYPEQDVRAAFVQLVTGSADFDEMSTKEIGENVVSRISKLYQELHKELQDEEKLGHMSRVELESVRAKAAYWNSMIRTYAQDPDRAIRGMHIVSEPKLGLTKVTV